MSLPFRHAVWPAIAVVAFATTLSAQGQRALSIDAIFDPATRVNFAGAPPPEIRWIDADTYISINRMRGRAEWVVDICGQKTELTPG